MVENLLSRVGKGLKELGKWAIHYDTFNDLKSDKNPSFIDYFCRGNLRLGAEASLFTTAWSVAGLKGGEDLRIIIPVGLIYLSVDRLYNHKKINN